MGTRPALVPRLQPTDELSTFCWEGHGKPGGGAAAVEDAVVVHHQQGGAGNEQLMVPIASVDQATACSRLEERFD